MFVFNAYSSLLLPAVIQCFLFALLAGWHYLREKRQSDLYFALLLAFTGIKLSFWMLGFAGWYDSHDGYTTFMFYFPFNIYLLSGPLVYFYFRSLTNDQFRIRIKDWPLLVLPALFILLIIGKFTLDFGHYYPFPNTPDYQFGTRGPFAELDKSLPVTLTGFASFFFYLLLTLRSFPAYCQYVTENFSDPDLLDFAWLRNMLLALFLGIVILLGFRLAELVLPGVSYKTDWFAYAALAVLSYYISINGYTVRNRRLYQLDYIPAFISQAVAETVSDDTGEEVWLVAVTRLMETSKPYLQPEFSLADLAGMLDTNRSVISRVINNRYQQNFNDFVNQYRVGEFVRLIKQEKHHQFSLLGLAYDCGFNSKATFNRAFKKVTGQTPSEFIRQQESSGE